MATINLGRVKPVFRGAYAGGTAYVIDDIVTYSNETYICILASTGNLPTDTTYWTKLAAKGTDGTNGTDLGTVLTTQGDLVYRDGSGLQRLGAGTAGQLLQSGGTGANPSWITADAGKTLQLTNTKTSTRTTFSASSSPITLMSGTHTQVKASSKLLFHYRFPFFGENSGSCRTFLDYDGTTYYEAWSWDYSAWSANTNTWSGHFILNAPASTGSKNWVIGYHSASGNATAGTVLCPNSSDDARLGQTVAEITIQELDF